MAENQNTVSSSSNLVLEPPKLPGNKLRIHLLDKFLAVAFNFLLNRSDESSVYGVKFATIILRGVLQYTLTSRFIKMNNVPTEAQEFLKDRLEKLQSLSYSLGQVADPALDERDRYHLARFPALVIMEVIMARDLDEISDLILKKEDKDGSISKITDLDLKMKYHKIDCWLHVIHNKLRKRYFGPYVSSNVFAGLLIRTYITQLLHENNLPLLDIDTVNYLNKRKIDYGMYIASSIQLERAVLTFSQFRILEHHPSLFILSAILHPNAGRTFFKLLTLDDKEIEGLSPNYLDEFICSFEESFEF